MSPIKIPKEKKWSGELAKESCDFNVLYIVIRWQIDGTYGVVSLDIESYIGYVGHHGGHRWMHHHDDLG